MIENTEKPKKGTSRMGKINVLDCTLRDGGYCNQWEFGYNNIKKIIDGLDRAGISISECGFLTQKATYVPGVTKFTSVEQMVEFLPESRAGKLYVAMMNYGEYNLTDLLAHDDSFIDGIRVAFHKKNWRDALETCKEIKDKGYLVFIQPMVSLAYSDEEFLEMIRCVNELDPYAFYIVDSFGEMRQNDLIRLFYLVEHNLKDSIRIGFHSHNNMQLAYSNAVTLVDMHSPRELIIDASVYGMGRGAGNLNTELFVEHLNNGGYGNYELSPLLIIIDEILNAFHERNFWGYSLPNYISAKHHAHPNYAFYLDGKKTLTVENMDRIFDMLDPEKRVNYDRDYIEKIYLEFMSRNSDEELSLADENSFAKFLKGKKILLIAPGKSSTVEKERIASFANSKDVVTISVNYEYPYTDVDYIFVSNMRRYRELPSYVLCKAIATSNLNAENTFLQVNYKELLSNVESVKDNAGLMAIKFFMDCGIKEIYLAGLDGYDHENEKNYGDRDMSVYMKPEVIDATNKGVSQVVTEYAGKIKIEFLTKPKYITIG